MTTGQRTMDNAINELADYATEHLRFMLEDVIDAVYYDSIEYARLGRALVEQHNPDTCGECEFEYTIEHPYTSICDEAMEAVDALLPLYTLPVVAIGGWKCLLTTRVTGVYCPHGYEVDSLYDPSPEALREWVIDYAEGTTRECCVRHGGH